MSPWRWFTLAGVVAVAVYFVLPGAVAPAVVYLAIGMGSAVAVATRARPRATPTATAWLLFAGGIALFSVGDAIWYGYEFVLHREVPGASVADVLYLAGYPLLAAGVLLLVRARTSGQGRDGVLDGLIVGLGACVGAWVWLIEGSLTDSSTPVLARVVTAAYPLMDVVILTVLVRLVLTESRSIPSYRLLLAGMALQLGGDLLYAQWPSLSSSTHPQPLDVAWLLSYILLAAAALHPSMRRLAEPVRRPRSTLGPLLIVTLGMALAAAPVVLALSHDPSGVSRGVLLVLFAGIAIAVLVRLRSLVADRDRDLVERDRIQDELSHSALHDALTGLPNRRLFLDRLDQALLDRARHGEELAVLFLDLDRFKVLNDSVGHHLGDQMLVEVADRLRQTVRPGDTIARFGGDEFTVLCERVATIESVQAIAKRLAEAASTPMQVEGEKWVLSASIGICLTRAGVRRDGASLLRDADAAMYRAKALGRDRYELFDDELRESTVARLETERSLRTALDQGALFLEFQPELVLATGELFGVEALVRWHHPEHGRVEPADFIPVAEETGLIVPIGTWVLRTACAQAAWWAALPGAPRLRMAVNVSARQLAQPDVVDVVTRALADSGLPAANLVLEVTESTLIEEGVQIRDTFDALSELGVSIALDDFGTGYSSLGFLRTFPVDIVKIDRSFVNGVADSADDAAIITAIVRMASSLGLRTVAEGVETAAQAEVLREVGCDLAQGYYFGRPAPASAIPATFHATRR